MFRVQAFKMQLQVLYIYFFLLDGSGPVDNRPSPDKLHHFVWRKKEKRKEKMTCDTWHVIRDTWHVTRDMWHVTHLGGWTFSQNFSSLAHIVCDLWYYEDLEEKDESLNEWRGCLKNSPGYTGSVKYCLVGWCLNFLSSAERCKLQGGTG